MTTNRNLRNTRLGWTALVIFLAIVFAGCLALMHTDAYQSSHGGSTPSAYDGPRTGGGDAEFLYLFKRHTWVTSPDGDAGLTSAGRAVCPALNAGYSRETLRLKLVQGQGWSDSDAAWMVTASVVAYCPEYVVPSDRW